MTQAQSAANHMIDLQRSKPPINSSTGTASLDLLDNEEKNAIDFQNVTFAYPTRPNQPVLRNFNLQILKGESIGIVGASGCGKSTLIALLERFYDVKSGQVSISGLPIQTLDVHQHRSRIGLVSQDTTLYQGTIKDNVLIGQRPGQVASTDDAEAVIQACKAANIHDFVMSLPDGYATEVGNRGISLSGGQRQRLAIARALVRDPEILLFDEATSALDTINEAFVQAAVEEVVRQKPGCTTIFVAHRLSTIKRCDRIIVLHQGQVVEEGSHEALLEMQGKYSQMVAAQALNQ